MDPLFLEAQDGPIPGPYPGGLENAPSHRIHRPAPFPDRRPHPHLFQSRTFRSGGGYSLRTALAAARICIVDTANVYTMHTHRSGARRPGSAARMRMKKG